jgi:alpha-D-xyloside xylohydrolase
LPEQGPISIRWEGTFNAETAGSYAFNASFDNGVKVWVDDKLIIDEWYQAWLPYEKQAHVTLSAGTHKIRADWTRDGNGRIMSLRWKTPAAERPITLWSEVAGGTDYTFVYGPNLDRVLAGYRQLTGQASLMPIWTLGLWQSRQRYETQQQSLDVVREFRKRQIPMDTIVQDWFYWRKAEWGSHQFDPERFPDPQGWVNAVHAENARLMISVWGKFYPGTANYDEMHKRGFLYEPLLWEDIHEWVGFPYTDYDSFNPDARKLFWSQVSTALFSKKFDAWWMDATEPDISSPMDLSKERARMNPTAAGPGSRVLNAYALENSRGVYEGQRSEAPDQRVFILTRSGFAGLQRYASATWSGDMPCTWESLKRQIPAGLGYSISGVPYWSMDIGGFTAPPKFQPQPLSAEAMDEWCELNARWFEFGSFVPLVRLHGESQLREPWAFGGDSHPAFKTIVKYDHLRYQLLPYVYSLAGAVTQDGTTFMRPLGMDFPNDAIARDSNDEYLFGPALLVAPVTDYKARQRSVYFPATNGGWYNFWTGETVTTAGAQDVAAPYDQIPLYVRAGSIVPFGPDLQYTTEKKADPVTVYVYAGANGAFSLYEDDGLTYGYEHGAFSRIALQWNDAAKTLTIGARQGSFPGMLVSRTFRVVVVSKDHARGYDAGAAADKTVTYTGAAVDVVLK